MMCNRLLCPSCSHINNETIQTVYGIALYGIFFFILWEVRTPFLISSLSSSLYTNMTVIVNLTLFKSKKPANPVTTETLAIVVAG